MSAKHRKPYSSWDSASGDREQPQMCATTGKREYVSEAEAKATAAHQMSQKESVGVQLSVYKCVYCGAWHLTSKKE